MPSGLIKTKRGPLVLLFYDGYELKAAPGFGGFLGSQARRILRFAKRTLLRQQVHTGFYAAFLSLRKSLLEIGCDVRVNDFALARKYPGYPLGIAGYSTIFEKIDLPNPRIFGPGDLGFPLESGRLAADPRNITMIQPSDWYCDIYRPYCSQKLWTWFAGIDTKKWSVAPSSKKTQTPLNFLVYDKIRWDREALVPLVLNRVTEFLEGQGHAVTVLRYGEHHQSHFRRALKKSQAMVFLCEHETQGLAYQEAMAMDIPILAWDEGLMADPTQKQFQTPSIQISSVPYFNEQCGVTFKINNFEDACAEFMQKIDRFRPREFVVETLALAIAGKKYLAEYERIAAGLSDHLPARESSATAKNRLRTRHARSYGRVDVRDEEVRRLGGH